MPTSPVSPPADIDAAKQALRQRLRRARREAGQSAGLSADRANRVADAVLAASGAAAQVQASGAVAVYASLSHEPPTHELRARLRRADVQVYLPVAHPHRLLTWVLDDGSDATAWGVGARDVPDRRDFSSAHILATVGLIVVPALAATADGRRLGQGGGYYDTLLAARGEAASASPLCLAVVGTGELYDDLPVGAHDARVDGVVVA